MSSPLTWLKYQFHRLHSADKAHPCFWKTDVHSHLLPGIDDGVKTYEQSLICIRQLADWGIQTIVTTPHINQKYQNQEAVLLAARDTLQEQVNEEGIPVHIGVAAEYMLDEHFLDRLHTKPLLSFGTERYLLVEMGLLAKPMLLEEMLFKIQTSQYKPVLAHPERYPFFYDDIDSLSMLREQGCLFQLNWMSLAGRYGPGPRRQARLLLKNKWVDFIGSDVHRPTDVPALESLFGNSSYELLRQQPFLNQTL